MTRMNQPCKAKVGRASGRRDQEGKGPKVGMKWEMVEVGGGGEGASGC